MDDRALIKAFRMRNLVLRGDAIKALQSVLRKETDPGASLLRIIGEVQSYLERHGGSMRVDLECITMVVGEMSRDEEDIAKEAVQLYSSFKLPKLCYDSTGRSFHIDMDTTRRSVVGPASAKIDMYRERYLLAHQRLLRDPRFAPAVLGSSRESSVPITPIESVSSSTGTLFLLGMLTQPEPSKFVLEDVRDRVTLDLSSAVSMQRIFTETSIVLVQGRYRTDDDVFVVEVIGFPPAESRAKSLAGMGKVDSLGSFHTPDELAKVLELQKEAVEAEMVVLSDVHLDDPKVMERLEVLFAGFAAAAVVPSLFVLIGNFCSTAFGHRTNDREMYVRHLDGLATCLCAHPSLVAGSLFVFVPGPNDPGASSVLPHPPLPPSFTAGIKARLPNCLFASNPCRIRFYTQEIVVFRADSLSRVSRHSVLPATVTTGGAGADAALSPAAQQEMLVMSLLDQGHLCPLPITVQPLYWQFDHAMRLYPLPHVVVLADDCDTYQWNFEESVVFNPGSFPRDSGFILYRPATCTMEVSSVASK